MVELEWTRVRELFERVLGVDPAERLGFIARECAGDDELRRRVEELLAAVAEDEDFLEPAIRDEAPALQRTGTRIDGFTIRRAIASGGMGTVFEAEQDHPRRTVALKMMRLGFDSPDAMRRFRFEAEILGRLNHPNIAQIYEANTLREPGGSALPYFAMEFVEDAQDLNRYAKTRGLDVRQRVQLFLSVSDAVRHGHEKGVIHRDLKPTNILVDGTGRPRVIDFGVARASDPQQASTSLRTEGRHIVGTLQYMAPEQLSGDADAVDTRTDVYALGGILYELLCEQPPFDFSNAPLPEAARQLREEDPAKPSSIRAGLPGDLDWIVLKALSKERERRYSSASELAADLRRFLQNEPVMASPPSRRYRLVRFVRRHRVPVIAAALIATALVIGSVGTTIGMVRAVEAADEARVERDTYEAIANFLENLLGSASPRRAMGEPPTIEQLLDRGADSIDSYLTDFPVVRARLIAVMADAYLALGVFAKAESLYRGAVDYCREHLGDEDYYTRGALNNLAVFYLTRGRPEEALPLCQTVLEGHLDTLGEDHRDTLVVHHNLADLYRGLGRCEEAESHLDLAIDGFRALGDAGREDLWRSLSLLGVFHTGTRRYQDGERAYREALDGYRQDFGPNYPDALTCYHNLAVNLHKQGRHEHAESACKTALDGRRLVLPSDHPEVFASLCTLANIYQAQGRHDEAEPLYQQAIEGRARVLGEHHPETLTSRHNLAALREQQKRYDESSSLHREVLEDRIRELGDEHLDTLHSMWNLARVRGLQGHPGEAETLYTRALAGFQRVQGSDHVETLRLTRSLGHFYRDIGRDEDAELQYKQAYEGSLRARGEDDWDTRRFLDDLASFYHRRARDAEAKPLVERALEIHGRLLGENHPHTVTYLHNLGVVCKALGRYEEAVSHVREALSRTSETDPDHAQRMQYLEELERIAKEKRSGRR